MWIRVFFFNPKQDGHRRLTEWVSIGCILVSLVISGCIVDIDDDDFDDDCCYYGNCSGCGSGYYSDDNNYTTYYYPPTDPDVEVDVILIDVDETPPESTGTPWDTLGDSELADSGPIDTERADTESDDIAAAESAFTDTESNEAESDSTELTDSDSADTDTASDDLIDTETTDATQMDTGSEETDTEAPTWFDQYHCGQDDLLPCDQTICNSIVTYEDAMETCRENSCGCAYLDACLLAQIQCTEDACAVATAPDSVAMVACAMDYALCVNACK